MNSTFWTNTIWYILLGILTLIQLVFVMVKAKRRRLTLALYLTTVGITLYFETIILIFFRAYAYYPMIIEKHSDPFNDVLAGNLFSQFSVSTTALLVSILDLKYYWYFIFGCIYGIIEELFIALGIYSHNWYQTWMTVLGFPILIWVVKKMHSKILQGIKPITYYGYIYMGLFTLYVVTLLWGLDVAGFMQFTTTLFNNPKVSRYSLYLVYYSLSSIFMMLIYFLKPKLRYKSLIIFILYAIYYTGYKQNLIWIKEGWFLSVTTIKIFWMYLSVFILDRLYNGPHKKV
ncbi:hypothetical protein [Pseudobacteroides cellulosolvens]|nr:hypothetical protein [Pseudobacteroides cellulosolvens]